MRRFASRLAYADYLLSPSSLRTTLHKNLSHIPYGRTFDANPVLARPFSPSNTESIPATIKSSIEMNKVLCHLVNGKLFTSESLYELITSKMNHSIPSYGIVRDVILTNMAGKSCNVGLNDGSIIFIRPVVVTYKSLILTP